MPAWLDRLFSPDFMPHGYCYLWDPQILWLHVISDCAITLAYFCIPVALVYLIRQRRDLPFGWVFWMFGAFIMGCGTTHLMEVWTVWHAHYLLSGIIKAFTAVVSLITAIMLVPLIPKAIALPSPAHLQTLNLELENQIVERNRIEASLQESLEDLGRRKTQLETVNKELEAFTYTVSHDIRAPLRHISGFSALILEESGPDLDYKARNYLQRIQKSTVSMGALVDDLLSLAQVGRQPLRLRFAGFNSIVNEIVSILEPETRGRIVEWKIADLPFVECDPILVKRVFLNLISNALKYSRPREKAIIEIGYYVEEGQPVIFVRDNGVGFDMKYADKLFGVCQRLHRAEDFEGTGVGLATVHRIVQKHGGFIWAVSSLDQGATFYFTLGTPTQTELLPVTTASMVGA